MKYFSMYAGIAGFEKGIEDAKGIKSNWKQQANSGNARGGNSIISQISKPKQPSLRWDNADCVGYSEIDRYAEAIYRYHYPKQRNYGDATKIDTTRLPPFDCLVAGFPCQSFSIAGKRGGFEDTRGTLFFEICRVARDKEVGYLWLENVTGLLSHDEGRTFQTVIESLVELGYDCQWQVLNSKYHGVPQNRERVFIIGHLRGNPRPKVFPITTNNSEIMVENEGYKFLAKVGAKTGVEEMNQSSTIDYVSYKGLGSNQPRMCVAELIDEKASIRRLTPIECERLQGFPDNWTKYGLFEDRYIKEISDSQRYKCLGNAVTTNVVRDIISQWIS